MKRKTLFFLLELLLVPFTLYAYDFKSGNLYYSIISDVAPYTVAVTYENIYATGANYPGLTTVTIPEKVTYNKKTYSVTDIGWKAFSDCSSLRSITLPSTLTKIEESAFEGCSSLTSITIPDNVATMGDYAFRNCTSLKTVTIGKKATVISYYSFAGCSALTSITISSALTNIENGAFYECKALTSFKIPNTVTSVGAVAFYSCTALKSVTIGSNVTAIGAGAFENCVSLTSVTIPDKVHTIYYEAFSGCKSLTSLTIGKSVKIIERTAFCNCIKLRTVTISSSVLQIIDEYAFARCTALTAIKIPASVKAICGNSFAYCNLSTIQVDTSNTVFDSRNDCNAIILKENNYLMRGGNNTLIPNTVEIIGDYAFSGAKDMTSISIPESVTSIEYNAFNECSKLSEIYCYGTTPPKASNNVFAWTEWKTDGSEVEKNLYSATLYVPKESLSVYKKQAPWSNFANIQPIIVEYTIITTCKSLQGSVSGGGTFTEGTVTTLTATPNDGYAFVQWSDGNTDNPRVVTVTENKTYTAEFVKTYIISVECNAIEGVVTGGGTYNQNAKITLTATPNEGYRFVRWNDGNISNPRTVTVRGNASYTAMFELETGLFDTKSDNRDSTKKILRDGQVLIQRGEEIYTLLGEKL